jgi:hypothetical protein
MSEIDDALKAIAAAEKRSKETPMTDCCSMAEMSDGRTIDEDKDRQYRQTMGGLGINSIPLGPGQFIQRGKDESPLSSQVGGNHYSKLAIQPAEYTTRNGLGHMAGDAIAYITRYKDKGGKQDLEKAIHSIQLLIALEYPNHE